MEYFITAVSILIISNFVTYYVGYGSGYKKGARSIMNEWRNWNTQFLGAYDELCPHKEVWEDCPDCNH